MWQSLSENVCSVFGRGQPFHEENARFDVIATKMEMDVYVLSVMIVRSFSGECDCASVVDIKTNWNWIRNVE